MPNRDFDSIYSDFSRLVFWAAYRVVSSKEIAEDITQTVFERVIKNKTKLSEMNDAQLKGWLYRVAVNLAFDFKRRNKKEILTDKPIESDIADVDDIAVSPGEEIVANERKRIMKGAIDSLSEIYREVIMLHYFSQMTTKEIATHTGISEGTIKSRLVRARVLLLERLKSEGYSNEA